MTQPTLQQWLDRKPAGKKPKRPLPRVTKKRAKQLREYSKRREEYLKLHPICQCCLKKAGIVESQTSVFMTILAGGPKSVEIHHAAGRIGEKLNDETHWFATCRPCHEKIHRDPKWARANGFLLKAKRQIGVIAIH